MKLPAYIAILLMTIASLFMASVSTPSPIAFQATPPTPGALSVMDMMKPPKLPGNPTQADYGEQVYYYVCMACHGDHGQGLTPEWVDEWQLGKNSCWQSKCHAANHPPDGFELPKNIPGVIGPILTQRFANGLELHNYIASKMPWHAPGSLKPEEYWQLTAFLLRENGLWNTRQELNETNAGQVIMRITSSIPDSALAPRNTFVDLDFIILVVAVFLMTLGFFVCSRQHKP
jgi:cytochrome c5